MLSWDGVITGRSVEREERVHNVHNVEEYPALCSKTKPRGRGTLLRDCILLEIMTGRRERRIRIIPLRFGKWAVVVLSSRVGLTMVHVSETKCPMKAIAIC